MGGHSASPRLLKEAIVRSFSSPTRVTYFVPGKQNLSVFECGQSVVQPRLTFHPTV